MRMISNVVESNRVNHVLKDIREEALNLSVPHPPTIVAGTLTICQVIEEAPVRYHGNKCTLRSVLVAY